MSKCPEVRLVETIQDMEAVLALRIEVFVREQGVPLEQEFDEYDGLAAHAVALEDGRVIGTGRLYGLASGEAQIGRMAVESTLRRQGIGERILGFLEDRARRSGVAQAVVHAQTYVRPFYDRRGYIVDGQPFMEVDIEHIRMVKHLA